METAVLLLVIFLFTDVMVVGICSFAYAGKEEYQDGMILGVHIPSWEVNNKAVQEVAGKYKRQWKLFQRWNMLFGILVCGFAFAGLGIFLLIWIVWFGVYTVGLYRLIYGSHRKLYEVKVENGWISESTRKTVYVDTELSAFSDKMPLSKWFYVPGFVLTVIVMAFPKMQMYMKDNAESYALFWITLGVNLFFLVFHIWIEGRSNVVYGKESHVNRSVNGFVKRTWMVIFVCCMYTNTIAWLYMAVRIMWKQWIDSADIFAYCLIQAAGSVILIAGIYLMLKKSKELIRTNAEEIEADDDIYWKSGWYNNPDDKRLWVPDRICSINYSMNMGKPVAKIIMGVTAGVVAACLIWMAVIVFQLETAKVTVTLKNDTMDIRAVSYEYQLKTEDILSVTLLDELPEDKFYRNDGGDNDKLLIGKFRGKDTGRCMMFVYKEESPVLEIKLKDMTVFLNSEEKEKTEEWYQYARDGITH